MGLALGHHIPGAVGDAPPVSPCSMTVKFDGPSPASPNLRFRYMVWIRPDGLRAWTHHGGVSHPAFDDTFQFDIPVPWQLFGWIAGPSQQYGADTLNRSMEWHDDGKKLTFLRRWFSSFRRIDTWDQSATPYDITVKGPIFASRTGIPGNEFLIRMSLDGSIAFVSRLAFILDAYPLTVPHDISTMLLTPIASFDATPFSAQMNHMVFSTDHTRMYSVTQSGLICTFDLAGPDDISTVSNFQTGVNINALPEGVNNLGIPRGLNIRPDTGDLAMFGDQNNYRVRCWSGEDISGEVDPDFTDVVLLLDFEGTDGAQAITDLSNSGHTETFFDNAQVNTAIRHLGANTLLLDGTDDEVTYPTSPDWAFGTGDFTIEFGLVLDAVTTMTLLSIFDTSVGWFIRSLQSGGQKFVFGHGASELINVSWTVPVTAGVTEHIAITRQGTTLSVWQEGALLATVSDSTNFTQGTKALRLGSLDGLTQFTDGTIGAVRITKGLARYTAPFTPRLCFYPIQ